MQCTYTGISPWNLRCTATKFHFQYFRSVCQETLRTLQWTVRVQNKYSICGVKDEWSVHGIHGNCVRFTHVSVRIYAHSVLTQYAEVYAEFLYLGSVQYVSSLIWAYTRCCVRRFTETWRKLKSKIIFEYFTVYTLFCVADSRSSCDLHNEVCTVQCVYAFRTFGANDIWNHQPTAFTRPIQYA